MIYLVIIFMYVDTRSFSSHPYASLWHFLSLFFLCLFIFEREKAQVGEGRDREGDIESKASSRLQAVSTDPDTGLEPTIVRS